MATVDLKTSCRWRDPDDARRVVVHLFQRSFLELMPWPRSPEMLDGRGDAGGAAEDGGAGYEDVGTGGHAQRGSLRIDAAVQLEIAARIQPVDHLRGRGDLAQRRVDESLIAKAGVHRHDQHLVHVRQNFLERLGRRGWIDHDAGPLAQEPGSFARCDAGCVAFDVHQERNRSRHPRIRRRTSPDR